MQNRSRKGFFLGLFVTLLGFATFLRTDGAAHVRAVQIVTLVVTGMGLGVAFAHLKVFQAIKSTQ